MPERITYPETTVSRVTEYTDEIAADLGVLYRRAWGDECYSGDPVSQDDLEFLTNSLNRAQLVATRHDPVADREHVIGAVTITEIRDLIGKDALVNNCVTDPEYRLQGVGRQLILAAMKWGGERNIRIAFTATDPETHAFYDKVLGEFAGEHVQKTPTTYYRASTRLWVPGAKQDDYT